MAELFEISAVIAVAILLFSLAAMSRNPIVSDQQLPDRSQLENRSAKIGALIGTVLKYSGTKHQATDEHGHEYEYFEFEDDNFHIGKGYLSISTTGEKVFDIKTGKIIQDGPWVEKFLKTYSKI